MLCIQLEKEIEKLCKIKTENVNIFLHLIHVKTISCHIYFACVSYFFPVNMKVKKIKGCKKYVLIILRA